jgi:hypothetical protein
MIREYSQKNSVSTLAFLVAGLTPIDKKVFEFCAKRRTASLLEKMISGSVTELHEFLIESKKIMDKVGEETINNLLYN